MISVKRRRLIVFAGISLMTAGILLGGALAAQATPYNSLKQDIIAVSVLPTGTSPDMELTQEDIANISDTLSSPAVYWGDVRGQLTTELRDVQADVYAVGGPFNQFHPSSMLYGCFLSSSSGSGNAVVLDKDLAWQLFGTVNAVGMTVGFQDKNYNVTGVCDTDTSLPGLLSGNGIGRAYITYNQFDLIPITGMEVSLPKALTGKSLQAVTNTLGAQGKAAASFRFTDITERTLIDVEASKLPLAVLAFILTLIMAAVAIRIIKNMVKETWLFAKERYIRECWKAILSRVSKMLIICITATGLVYLLWLLTDFSFYLPARYIPGSWIDLDFYKSLIQTEAQAAIAAKAYLPQPWDILHDAAMQLSGWMNALALAGMAVYALGLRLLRDARETDVIRKESGGWRSSVNDLLSIWIYIVFSVGISLLIDAVAVLPMYLPVITAVLLCLGISLWAARRLYHDEIIGFFKQEKDAGSLEEGPLCKVRTYETVKYTQTK